MAHAPYGSLPDGTTIEQFTLRNSRGMCARILTYGGIVTALETADRAGRRANIVLGCADLEGYRADTAHFGTIVGRYANRIARGRFILDGAAVQLTCNDGPNSLHGGDAGFGKVVWRAVAAETPMGACLALHHVSPHGAGGYPGILEVEVRYTVTPDDALRIDYEAETDRPTVVNLTHHGYFNLAGAGARDVYDHALMIAADAFTPVDATLIPTGELQPVAGGPFDFCAPATIGARLRAADPQLRPTGGFDHNFILAPATSPAPRLAAQLSDPTSGRTMTVLTTEPGLQFYTGNFLGGRPYGRGAGLCLETQHFPDSPNQPAFPSTVLRPGERFRSTTLYQFSVAD
ncbi:MAG: galactose mutarotase [Proteobacteria bacterium]|nr:galactose mutarotase [Pseudomonadota bacterium]